MTTMRETEIRPDALVQPQESLLLVDSQALLRRKSEFVAVHCPACDANVPQLSFEKYELSYVRCRTCETVYISPRPTPEILEEFYRHSQNYAYFNEHIFPASESVRREKIFRPRVARLLEICDRHNVGNDVLVEVGAGFGIFCEEVRNTKRFGRVIGIEPTPDLAETCRRKGLETIELPIERVSLEQSASVIASFEVIEHLFSPKAFLRQCASLLSPGGLVIITCPNVKGFDIQVLQAASGSVDYEHLNYFHPRSLSRLMDACGFDVLEMSTPGKLDAELVRKKALTGELDLTKDRFLQQVLVDEWDSVGDRFQEFLANNMLSSHLWAVGKKR